MKTKTKKELQNELELLELQKKILEVKLEDNRWETVYPYRGYTITTPYYGPLSNGATTNNRWDIYQV